MGGALCTLRQCDAGIDSIRTKNFCRKTRWFLIPLGPIVVATIILYKEERLLRVKQYIHNDDRGNHCNKQYVLHGSSSIRDTSIVGPYLTFFFVDFGGRLIGV